MFSSLILYWNTALEVTFNAILTLSVKLLGIRPSNNAEPSLSIHVTPFETVVRNTKCFLTEDEFGQSLLLYIVCAWLRNDTLFFLLYIQDEHMHILSVIPLVRISH